MHCSAASARWSYCPGRYSTAKTWGASGRASSTSSVQGSANTAPTHAESASASSPSTS